MDTAANIISRVRTRLEDPNSRFFDDDDLILAYNDALDEISDATEVYEESIVVPRRKSALYTDLRGVLPDEALRVTAVWNLQTNKWMNPTTPTELDQLIGRSWETRPDPARWWFMRGLWHLATYPVPGDDTSPVRVHYSAMMRHVDNSGKLSTGTSTSAPLPRDFAESIEHYMMYTLLCEKKEFQKSIDFWSQYKAGEDAILDLSDNRMTRDKTPHMGSKRESSMGARR